MAGDTAEAIDEADTMSRWLPIVFAFVLGLSFMLLTVAFRSLVVAAKAIAVNLLSVGAAYGLLVLVFQQGVGNEIFGFPQVDAIEAWIPLFLFAVLFGLSMDYHVFLLSRIRERYGQTGDNRDAIVHGVGSTGRIITGAALHHHRRVQRLRSRRPRDVPADGVRRRRRPAPGRHRRAPRPRSRRDGAARRPQLVPTFLAALAAGLPRRRPWISIAGRVTRSWRPSQSGDPQLTCPPCRSVRAQRPSVGTVCRGRPRAGQGRISSCSASVSVDHATKASSLHP